MNYSICASNGQTYDIPKKSIVTMDKLDAILKIDRTDLSLKQKYQKVMDFVAEMLGSDNAKEILGSDKITEIDIGELEVLVLKIKAAYDRPVDEYREDVISNSLDSIPTDKLLALSKAADTISNATLLRK